MTLMATNPFSLPLDAAASARFQKQPLLQTSQIRLKISQFESQQTEQVIFIVRPVIGDLNGGIRVEERWDGIFPAQNQTKIRRRIFYIVPFQKILPRACGHPSREFSGVEAFYGFHGTEQMHAPALNRRKAAHIRK